MSENDAALDNAISAVLADHMDGFVNGQTKLGRAGKDNREATVFERRQDFDEGTISAMYEQNPLFARIIEGPAEDATRRWIKITVDDDQEGESGKLLMDDLEALCIREKFFDLLRYDRLDGGAAMILGAADGLDPEEPLDLTKVKSLDFVNVLSRWECSPSDFDQQFNSPTFRQPQYFTFVGQTDPTAPLAGNRIHWSRVLMVDGIQTTWQRRTQMIGWGSTVLARVWEELRGFGTIWGHIEGTFKDINQPVFSMEGLADIVAKPDGAAVLMRRAMALTTLASTFNVLMLDKDTETFERRIMQFPGVSDVILRAMDRVCQAAEMPATRLFGVSPGGLSTDDQSGMTTYYDKVSNLQQKKIMRHLRRIVDILASIRNIPLDKIAIQCVPLEEPNEKETAETEKLHVDADIALVTQGVITPDECRTRMINDPHCPYTLDEKPNTEPVDQATAEQMAGELGGMGGPSGTSGAVAAQDTALNGAQVTSAIEIVQLVAGKKIPRDSGIAMLQDFFNLTSERAERVMGKIGTSFFVEEPVPTAPTSPVNPPGNKTLAPNPVAGA